VASKWPVHVTMKVRRGLPSLRRKKVVKVLFGAFAKACERPGFRVVEFSIQRDHLHLIVEGQGREAVARGLQGLAIRVAKGLNRLWGRAGKVWADRYHDRVLRTPREVRNALAYVLQNARRHGVRLESLLDPFASGAWFRGWRRCAKVEVQAVSSGPVEEPGSWLLRKGWRRHGLLVPWEVPGPPPH